MADAARRSYKASPEYLRDQRLPKTLSMSAPLAQQQQIAEWRAQYDGLAAAVEDSEGFVALIGTWREPPAAVEQSGGSFGQGEVANHLYVLTHIGYLPDNLLATILPSERYRRGAFELVTREALRRTAQCPDRHMEREQLEAMLAEAFVEMRASRTDSA